jgi:hypothetical protein
MQPRAVSRRKSRSLLSVAALETRTDKLRRRHRPAVAAKLELSFPGKNGGYCDCRENGYGAGCYGRNRRNTDCRNNSSLGASDAFYECEHRAGEKDDRELLEVGSLDDLGCDMKPDCKADEEPGKSGQQKTGPISDRPRDDCQIDIKLDLARQRPKRPVDGGRLGIRLKYARQGIVNSEQDC